MKKAFDDYVYLAGSARGGCSLWEGPDHLLVIETTPLLGFSESYKRIDYARVETISYGATARFAWTIVWQVLLLAPLAFGAHRSYQESLGAGIVLGGLALVVAVSLIIHLIRGPTCVCRLQTAVQVLKLKPLDRVRTAERVVTRLRQLCLQHQGGQETSTEAFIAAGETALSSGALAGGGSPPFTGSHLMTLALALLIPAGAMTVAEPFVDNLAYFFGDSLLGLVAHTLAVTALARCYRFKLPVSLRISLWTAAVNMLVSFILGYAMLMSQTFKQTMAAAQGDKTAHANLTEASLWRWMSHASFEDLGWFAWPMVITGAVAIFCGLLGLPAALRPPARGAAAPSAPQPPPVQPPPVQHAAVEPPSPATPDDLP